ncbi:MAG: dihydrofolate reductase [Candidatus Woesearchaeota archaeon]
MTLNLIVAMTNNRVIGLDNTLPWRIPEEMKNFKELTTGNVVIMGRKTYESIPEKYRPLPNRDNVVISSQMSANSSNYNGIVIASTLQEAVDKAKKFNKEMFIMGGAQVYKAALPLVDKMYISIVKEDYKGNVYFPEINMTEWNAQKLKSYNDFDLWLYKRFD